MFSDKKLIQNFKYQFDLNKNSKILETKYSDDHLDFFKFLECVKVTVVVI